MRPRPIITVVAAALALSAALAGCGGGDDSKDGSAAAKASAQAVAEANRLSSTWPMTGLPVTGNESAAQHHPVMVLKMDNTEASAPQKGLGEADMVVEELVEGGLTRLAAFYYSHIPGVVGPVRSMRASDIGIVSPVKADVVTSGAAQVTINRIKGAGITFFQEGAAGFFRDDSRIAPYNLFTDMSKTAALAHTKGVARPTDYLPWASTSSGNASSSPAPTGQPATTLDATFSSGHTTHWTYQNSHYVNTNSNADADDQFPADSVLVLRVKVGNAGYLDPAGNTVPETKLVGGGSAVLFHGGTMVRCGWSKSALGAPIKLSTAAGPMTIPAGHTWLELVPKDGGSLTVGH